MKQKSLSIHLLVDVSGNFKNLKKKKNLEEPTEWLFVLKRVQ